MGSSIQGTHFCLYRTDPGVPAIMFATTKPLRNKSWRNQISVRMVLVAYNATFDVGFMNVNYERHGLPKITHQSSIPWSCPQPLSDFKRHLEALDQQLGVGFGDTYHS